MNVLGARYLPDGRTVFGLWSPEADDAAVVRDGSRSPMVREVGGTWRIAVEDAPPGTRYRYAVTVDGDALEVPDPASRSQPDGVHGASEVVDPEFPWTDDGWRGRPLHEYVIYELHVGTFTTDGTFEAAIDHLDDLVDLGITAVEVMPIAEFPGGRNWGYDGVLPFAAQSTYGGPDGFRALVDACHARGLAVVLDVVYNHFGPEGAYQTDLAPYLTDRYATPWGPAINFDGPGSDGVRRTVVDNALWWTDDCHVDALRLDAVHAILDRSAIHILEELADAVHRRAQLRGRHVHVIAESDLNDPRVVRSRELGGYGLDGVWSDDFHHALHALLTGERTGYYADFGTVEHLAAALRDGFVFTGQRSAYRGHRHGRGTGGISGERFVVCAQNHDQVGNRLAGDRLSTLLDAERLRVAATCVLLAPYVPLLFMGEEYGETAPFRYFVSHTDPDLVEAVRRGRREEFASFGWEAEPPDPQDEETFRHSRLDRSLREKEPHAGLLALHRELLRLRRSVPALRIPDRERLAVVSDPDRSVLSWRRWEDLHHSHVLVLANLGDEPAPADPHVPSGTRWGRVLDTQEERWDGDGGSPAPHRLDAAGDVASELPPRTAAVYVEVE